MSSQEQFKKCLREATFFPVSALILRLFFLSKLCQLHSKIRFKVGTEVFLLESLQMHSGIGSLHTKGL